MLTSGALAPVFWTQVALMAVSVVILVVPKLRTTPGVVVASVLAILGVFCKRLQILVGGFQIPNLDMPGVTTQYAITNWQGGVTGAYQANAADRIRRHARRARHVRSVLAAGPEVPALEALRERRLAPLFSSEPDAAPPQTCRVRLFLL